ncbi:MAG: phage capsid protein [Dehalococcoidia bacterium]
MAASTVTTAFTEQYSALVYMLSQQKGSKFRNLVRNETVSSARNAYFERLGLATAQEITTRHGDTPLNEIPHSRRRLTPADYNTATLLDHQDQLKMLIDPKSPYANAQAMELGRIIDDVIIAAALGSVSTGQSGGTEVTFANDSRSMNGDGSVTALGTAATPGTQTDITLAKILAMMNIFNEEDVDPDIPKYWAVSPREIQIMLDITEIGSADFNTVKALAAGKVDTFSGFNFFWTNRLLTDATEGTTKRSIAWAQDGLILGTAQNITSKISERDDKNYSIQVYAEQSLGAIRLEGKKVHESLNGLAS